MIEALKRRARDHLATHVSFASAWPELTRNVMFRPETVATPECVGLPLMPEAEYLRSHQYASPESWWALVEGALYHTDCTPNDTILARRGRIVAESDNISRELVGGHAAWTYAWRSMYTRQVKRLSGHCMVLRSPASNYYHTLVDNLPRIMALHDPLLAAAEVSVVVPGSPTRFEAWFLERLLPAHARIAIVARNALYRPDALVFASYASRQMCGFLPRPYIDFLDARVRPRRASRRDRRLYISRDDVSWRQESKGRRVRNEQAVSAALEARGFERVVLERLSLEAQIETLHDARAVVAPHGAGLANLLFCDDVDVVELHPCPRILPHYYYLSKAKGHRYHFLAGNAHDRNDNFEVDVEALVRIVEALD